MKSGTCVPASNLLQPIVKHDICPVSSERFELRTRALGCGCSTTTLLSILVTIPATLVAAALLYLAYRLVLKLNTAYGTGTYGGVELIPQSHQTKPWRRSTSIFWPKFRSRARSSEQDLITERTRLMSD